MADNTKTTKKKSIGADVIQQIIDEVVPYVAYWMYGLVPPAWREKLKSHPIYKVLPSVLSVVIGQLTPDGGIWDHVDSARTEFMSTMGRLIARGEFGIGTPGQVPPPPTTPTTPEGQRFVQTFQKMVETMNLFVIDGQFRENILGWLARLPEEEQTLAMDMVQSMSRVELENFAQSERKDTVWRAHFRNPKNKPIKPESWVAKFLKEMDQDLGKFNSTVLEPALHDQGVRITDRENAWGKEDAERKTLLGKIKHAFK